VALALGCTLRHISNWVAAWRAGGLEGVREKPRRGPARSLDAAGEALLAGLLAQDPRARGHRAAGWTAPLLRTELAAAGYTLSEHTIRRSLRRLGFRLKPPSVVFGVAGTERASGQPPPTFRSG
jgi:transposase